MRVSDKGIALIAKYEGIRLAAYKCSAGVWTIGLGSTRYEDGSPVQAGDVLPSEAAAYQLFANTLGQYERAVSKLSGLKQCQFDALVSLCYNIGVGAFGKSTAYRLASANPDDPAIREAIGRFNKAGGKVVQGLVNRRKAEADHYFG
jgi:lysozyme